MRVIALTRGLVFMIAVWSQASKGAGWWPSTTSPLQIHGQQFAFLTMARPIRGVMRKRSRVGDARADMAEPFDEFLLRKNPAGADDVFFQLIDGGPWDSFKI